MDFFNFKICLVIFITICFVSKTLSESLCSQMGGDCNSYWEGCWTRRYSMEHRYCSRYGKPPICCFHDYWDNDCIRRGGTCFDIRFSTCTNGRYLAEGCGGEYRYCCAPRYYYPYYQTTQYSQADYYSPPSRSYQPSMPYTTAG